MQLLISSYKLFSLKKLIRPLINETRRAYLSRAFFCIFSPPNAHCMCIVSFLAPVLMPITLSGYVDITAKTFKSNCDYSTLAKLRRTCELLPLSLIKA